MKTRILSILLCLAIVLGIATPAFAEYAAKAPAPASIKLSTNVRSILPGGFYKLNVTIKPAKASKKVTWTSSDPSIAIVNDSGRVEAKAEGSCTITVTTENGALSAECAVSVQYNYATSKVRFFGIANAKYYRSPLDSPINDLRGLMDGVYSRTSFQGAPVKRYMAYNQSGNGIRKLLKGMSTKYKIQKTDITIFYYSGHGYGEDRTQSYRGALVGVDSGRVRGNAPYVRVNEVRKYLDKVPGTVIVILDSCLSGQYIESKGIVKKATASAADTKAYTDAWVASLSASDATNYVVNKALTGNAKSFKYKILAACASRESAWLADFDVGDGNSASFSLLTFAFYGGAVPYMKSNGSYGMEADRNGDQQVSLAEIYEYSLPIVKEWARQLAEYFEEDFTQTVTAWPMGDPFPVSSYT